MSQRNASNGQLPGTWKREEKNIFCSLIRKFRAFFDIHTYPALWVGEQERENCHVPNINSCHETSWTVASTVLDSGLDFTDQPLDETLSLLYCQKNLHGQENSDHIPKVPFTFNQLYLPASQSEWIRLEFGIHYSFEFLTANNNHTTFIIIVIQ